MPGGARRRRPPSRPLTPPIAGPSPAAGANVPTPLGRGRIAIFLASGFAGLIYESIWTHYLQLFLGHAAYAQTLVLAIFMGGMALGAALAARFCASIRNPLATYALIEAAIGALAIGFHPVFVAATGGFYDIALDRHLGGGLFDAIKWSLAALLILPQSILLGATFPVFASAATRAAPAGEGRPIATLYFANSIGGSAGVLASGFLLIPWLGLPGTIAAAGAVNIAIAGVVAWMLHAAAKPVAAATTAEKPRRTVPAAAAATAANSAAAAAVAAPGLLVAVSFLTGASSFIYEIGWIRMLSLVLGSATHSFELMLSSFVLGLALGGLWIRKRVDTSPNPGALLGNIQVLMGLAALATVPLHNATFDLVAWALQAMPKTGGGYVLFNLLRYGVASLIMFPAAFCAGMTLPLVTRMLYAAKGQGERAIGVVYSANTVGAIAGLAFAVHVGLPVIGLEYLVASGAVIDVALGAVLLAVFGGRARLFRAAAAVVASVAGAVAAAATFDPQKLTSGVFRTAQATNEAAVVDIAHGKTATISVEKGGDRLAIRTNGKTDGSANIRVPSNYTPDEVTVNLLGAVPLMLHPDPRRVASIGMGSGITGQMILNDPRVRHLDTIEIEPKMVELARHFGELNRSVYEDQRSTIHVQDAKSYFAANGETYDLIVSEPSNPWVSGVSGLFSVEFYRHAARYLNEGGLFAQWLQSYEMHADRAASVLKAMDQVFDDYLVVALDQGDVLLVGSRSGKVALPPNAYALLPRRIRDTLKQLDIAHQPDITFRIVGNKAMFRPWLDARPVAPNSDFFPYLDNHADRDRFLGSNWSDLPFLALSVFPIPEILGGREPLATPSSLSISRHFGPEPVWLAARLVKEILFGPDYRSDIFTIPGGLPEHLANQGQEILNQCAAPPPGDSPYAATRLGTRVLPYLSPTEGRAVLAALTPAPCLTALYGTQQQWPELLRHVANRNPRGFGPLAGSLLENGQGGTEVRARYLLGIAMLGYLGSGEPGRAMELWDKYAARAFAAGAAPDLAFEMLRAHASRQPLRR